MMLTHGEDNLMGFTTYLNGIHPTIKLTHEENTSQINFLHTAVKINDSRNYTQSCMKNPLTFICTSTTPLPIMHPVKLRDHMDNSLDSKESVKLISHYLKRGYPEKALRKHYKRASKLTHL